MAPPKRKTGGRVTPAGTRPGEPRAATATAHGEAEAHHYESGRYTAPIPKSAKESPRWVPILMLAFLIVGAVLIMLRYLAWDNTNLMLVGMVLLLAGLYTGTKWR